MKVAWTQIIIGNKLYICSQQNRLNEFPFSCEFIKSKIYTTYMTCLLHSSSFLLFKISFLRRNQKQISNKFLRMFFIIRSIFQLIYLECMFRETNFQIHFFFFCGIKYWKKRKSGISLLYGPSSIATARDILIFHVVKALP